MLNTCAGAVDGEDQTVTVATSSGDVATDQVPTANGEADHSDLPQIDPSTMNIVDDGELTSDGLVVRRLSVGELNSVGWR